MPLVLDPGIGEKRHNKRKSTESQSTLSQSKRHKEAPSEQREASGSSGHSHSSRSGTSEDIADSQREGKPPPFQNFACPFFKLDAKKHQGCESLVLTTWARTLQHIKRKHHVEGHHCSACRQSFKKEGQKNDHIRKRRCQTTGVMQSGVLLEGEYKKIKNLRHSSQEARWIAAWEKLFPGLQAPSPRAESHTEFVIRTGPSVCLEFLQRASQGHVDLAALASELVDKLARPPTPAARSGAIIIAATQALQSVGPVSVPDLGAGSLHLSSSLSGLNPWITAPGPGNLSPDRQILPELQQVSPYLPGETFGFEAIQGPLSQQASFPSGSSGLHCTSFGPEYPLMTTSLEMAADLQGDLPSDVLSKGTDVTLSRDESILLGGFFNVYEDEDDSTYI